MKWLTDKSFSIHAFQKDSNKAKGKFYKSILSEEKLVSAFFDRMFPDWQELLNEKIENWYELLPEISFANGESKLAAVYSGILYESIEWQHKDEIEKTVKRIKTIAESQTEETADTAEININMGSAYAFLEDTKSLNLALKYHEKALEIGEKVLGKKHELTLRTRVMISMDRLLLSKKCSQQ